MKHTLLLTPAAFVLVLLAGCQKNETVPTPTTASAPLPGSTIAINPAPTPAAVPDNSSTPVAAAPLPDTSNSQASPPNPQSPPQPADQPQVNNPRDAKNYANK
ncbi:MAG TPA: hypothetical protein VH105_00495 [Burkholderiales bacterium]|nr:hypothetical protein [Burkholderiales bacterium]